MTDVSSTLRQDEPRQRLDARGLHCPLPILRTRVMLDRMAPGQVLLVEATDPASVIDFKHFCNTTAHALLECRDEDGVFYYLIRCGGDGDAV